MQAPETSRSAGAREPAGPAPTTLDEACAAWSTHGDERPLRRWLAAELDFDGSPKRLAVEEWGDCLERFERALRARAGWSDWVRERVGGLFMWRVHASRPDGSTVFGPTGRDRARVATLV